MAVLTIRNIDEALKARLRVRAAENGRSMEAEVRQILAASLGRSRSDEGGLGSRISSRFASLDTRGFELPDRKEPARAAELER